VSDRWAALINLSQEREARLAAILAPMGVRVCSMGWEQIAAQAPSDQPPSAPPALIVALAEDYGRESADLAWLCPGERQTTVALLAQAALTPEGLRTQLHYDIFNVIPDVLWDDPACFERTFRGLLFPEEMFDIQSFVPNAALVKCFTITNLVEKRQVADEIAALARPYTVAQRRLHDIRLVIIELINNALFHSFRDGEGQEKYSPRRFLQLEANDRVVLEAAMTDQAIALAVEDNRGTISPREVLKYLQRQTSGEGIYDSHGRGFYLVSSIVDHRSVCLVPGQRARVVAMSHAGKAPPIRTLNFYISQ
jgi:anti-sigma regulatory factor (Ser/Thr protein kinase)